jgi:hypothetical protein
MMNFWAFSIMLWEIMVRLARIVKWSIVSDSDYTM